MLKYNIKYFFILLRAIWNIRQVVDCLEAAGYIIEKDGYSTQNRERDYCYKTLIKIGAWKIKK